MYRPLVFTALLLSLALALVGCDKVRGDRDKEAARAKARAAIDAYSKASERANVAHAKVLAAFKSANGANSLQGYRKAMRDEVLPRMNEFIGRLEGMQTGTEELGRIHRVLVGGYRDALAEIRTFVKDLDEPGDLARFPEIRARLQQRVKAYRGELDAYYKATPPSEASAT